MGRRVVSTAPCSSGHVVASIPITMSPQLLAKRLQISGHRVQVVIVQSHRRHKGPGFDSARVFNPQAQIVMCVSGYASSDGVATHEMSQIWTEVSLRRCAGYGM